MGADYDVVIIGAGMAGLTAARLLSRAGPGLKVLILESRDRVGGRMLTAQDDFKGMPSHGVELGAQLIHGSKAPTWELIKEFDIATRSLSSQGEPQQWVINPGGAPTRRDPRALAALNKRVLEAYANWQGPDISYQAFLDSLPFTAAEKLALAPATTEWSADPERMSLAAAIKDSALWDEYADEDFQVIGGYSSLVDKIAGKLEGKIQLKSTVTGIYWRQGIAGVSFEQYGANRALTARRIITTLPVGVLQSGLVAIEPALPEWKQRSIDALEMGQVVVVPMLFDKPDWRDKLPAPGSLRTADERTNFYLPHPAGKGSLAITGWFQGAAARTLSELGPEEGLAQVLRWLEEAGGIKNAGASLQWHGFQDWVKDPHSMGSYSITRPGGHGQRAELAKPVEDTLHFAGEATAPPPHYQTVHGAYMSGKRVALEVATSLDVGDTATFTEDAPAIITEDEAPIIVPL
jgi:monoamine oxidase